MMASKEPRGIRYGVANAQLNDKFPTYIAALLNDVINGDLPISSYFVDHIVDEVIAMPHPPGFQPPGEADDGAV